MAAVRLVAASLLVLVALVGCGSEEPETMTAPNGDAYNEADVRFATEMMQHHAQALAMVDLTRGRQLSPDVSGLADEILAAQAPEIETMKGWLVEWGEPVPATTRDHASEHGAHEADTDMPGMLSTEEMHALETAPDGEFEDRWLEAMVEHHEGAIEMARAEQADGRFRPAVELADAIESAQRDEIEHMRELLGS